MLLWSDPESKKSTLKKLLKNHLESVIKQRPDLKIIYVADGAQDNWTFFTQGGQAILTLRALIKSHRFEKAWPKVAGAYLKSITIPSNILPFILKIS